MKTIRNVKGLAGALIVTSSLFAAWSANAVETLGAAPANTRTLVVRYDDLDLERQAGVRALYERLASAAAQACGDYDRRDAHARRSWRACYEAALEAAVTGFGDPALSAVHDAADREVFPERVAAATAQ